MPKTKLPFQRLVQPDLFGAPAVIVDVIEPAPPTPKPRRRKVHETQRAAHRALERTAPTNDQRVEWDIKGNGKIGRTRQEITDRTGIPINSVCGAVDRLLSAGKIFEPVIELESTGRAIHYIRERRKVLVDALYRDTFDWLRFGQLLRKEPAA